MPSLLSVGELRMLVQTSINDTDLQTNITWEEDEVIRIAGPHYVDPVTTITETYEGRGANLYLRRGIESIVSVVETRTLGGTPATLVATDYQIYAGQGRIGRLTAGAWGQLVTIQYVPVDDTIRRKRVLIELCRLAIERTAMKSESVGGEYSYQAPDWSAERARLLRSLTYRGV